MSDDANDWNSSSFPAVVVVEVNKPNCTRRAACTGKHTFSSLE